MMLKKLLSAALSASMLASMAVIPAHAENFSRDNWVQYERGLYTSTSNFSEYKKEYTDTSYGTGQLTSVRMVANTSSKITSQKNPVAYKIGQNASDYGDHASDSASYAHMVFYLATYDDANHNLFDDFYLRMDKDGTGSSRDAFVFDNWKNDSEIYAVNYTTSAAYTTKDWTGILKKQGYNGNGPSGSTIGAGNEGSQTRVLSDSDYDKIDIIVEYNKQSGATTYIFANGKFMADYYDSGLTDKHFHGIVFRTLANKTPRSNSSYIAVKMDPNRIGHREYYNTDGYYVTLEDVMQDAGLGDSVNDSSVMFKTSEIQNYMPGNDQVAYVYPKDASARSRINTNITYSGNTATINCTNTDTENYAVAANMLSGFYPLNGKCGVAYEDYQPRAKYIKLSFDQTISNSSMWLKYDSYYSGAVQALQMWDNGGSLVVSIKGGDNVTCNGNGNKPTADMTGKNRIDWILEPVNGEHMNQYVFVNGKYIGSGNFGNQYAVRVADIILNTKNAAGTVTIDDWSMTVYNDTADFDDIRYGIEGVASIDITWNNTSRQLGYDINYDGGIDVYAVPSNIDGAELDENTKIITALYDQNDGLIGFSSNLPGDVNNNGIIINSYAYSENIRSIKLFIWDTKDDNIVPKTDAVVMPVSETKPVSAQAVRIKNNAKAIITIVHDDGTDTTVRYLNREFEKNNLVGTIAMIGGRINNDTKVAQWTSILNDSHGRFNLASHSYYHRYLGESDDAESGTLRDGTEYSYDAGHMTKDIANERSRINRLFPNERVLTFIKPGTSFPEGKQQVSEAAMNMIKAHYIAMRNTGNNVDTVPPEDYYSVKSHMAKPDEELQVWINLLSSATSKEGMLVYLFHEIKDADTASGNDVRQSDVSEFLDHLSRYYVSNGRVWNAKFDEAMQYAREYEAITGVTALNNVVDHTISVSVTDSISRIDTDIKTGKYAGRDMYDYPITVKVEIPYDWDYVKLTQSYDNRIEILKTFTENSKRYVYANVVPDKAAAVLSEAAESDHVTSVSYGGTAVSGFEPSKAYYKVTLPGGTTTAPTLTCDKGSAVITQASLTDGEGSGFIEYGGLKYEVHFSVE